MKSETATCNRATPVFNPSFYNRICWVTLIGRVVAKPFSLPAHCCAYLSVKEGLRRGGGGGRFHTLAEAMMIVPGGQL